MIDFAMLLSVLAKHEVNFVISGGVAATAHGSVRLTRFSILEEELPDRGERNRCASFEAPIGDFKRCGADRAQLDIT